MASVLFEKGAVAMLGLGVYVRLSSSSCVMWDCASRVFESCKASFRTGGSRLRDDEEAWKVATAPAARQGSWSDE